jgi:hypothetical protein
MSVNDQYREEHNKALVEFGEKLRAECAKHGFGCTIEWDRKKPYKNGVYEFNFELNRYEGVPLSEADSPAPQSPDKLRNIKGSYAISSLVMRETGEFVPRLARELLHFLDKERHEEFVMEQYAKLSDEAKKLFHHACQENHAVLELHGYYDEKRFFNELAVTTLVHSQEMPFDVTIFPTGDGRLVQALLSENKIKKKGKSDALPRNNP